MRPNYATEAERAAAPCYIARHACGLVVGVTMADDPDHAKDVAKDVASWVRRGYVVERVTVTDATAGPWCSCFQKPKQAVEQTSLLK